jgi:diguanylate cyclase (GGDEF)-like protein
MAIVETNAEELVERNGNGGIAIESELWPAQTEQIARIQRIGKRLFSVARCLVQWYGDTVVATGGERSMAAIEAAFCRFAAPLPSLLAVPDTRIDPRWNTHRSVVGAPYIRFYAACPILNSAGVAVGCLSLIDYNPHAFGAPERQLLADLAAQVERELQLQALGSVKLDLLKKNKSLSRESLLDPLVGTWNRAAIMRLVTIEKERCSNNSQPLSLILVGIDYFKRLNETLGQPACDTILVKIASRLRSCVRPGDALGRYIGDQMLVVLPGASHIVAESVAERMRRAITLQPDICPDGSSSLSISAGTVSSNLFAAATAEEMMRQAELALYAAKNAGRNCVMQAKPDLL